MTSYVVNLLADARRDLKFGLRAMRKAPIFTVFAVVSLGLGIGANTTVFTIINSLLLNPLPVSDPGALAALYDEGTTGSRQRGGRLLLSYANFQDYAKQEDCFSGIAAFTSPLPMTLLANAGHERVFGQFVTSQYFDTLGLKPAAGRFFMADEDTEPGFAPVAVLSYNAWKARFGGSPNAVGRTLEVNNVAFTIIGVAPKDFLGLSAVFGPDLWMPATMSERAFPAQFRDALSDRAKPSFHGIARLKQGMTLARAQTNLEIISAGLERTYPDANEGHGIRVRPITEELFSNAGGQNGLAVGSGVLMAVVLLVLGIACSNVANLLLARGAARRQEVAVLMAVGASRGRLIRQMLTESLMLSLLGFAAGLIVGYAGSRFLWSFVPVQVVQNMVTPRLDGVVMVFAFILSLATAFLFGMAPALKASKTDVSTALKQDTRTASRGRGRGNIANLLVAGQVAFSLVCLITATLFFRSIQRAYVIDPGFQTDHLAVLMMNPAQAGYDETRVRAFYRAAIERVSALPGVRSASWASGLPFWNGRSRSIAIEGVDQRKKTDMISTVALTVDTDYFRTMGIELTDGKLLTDNDRDGSLPVAVINEALAREHWPGASALGHRFQFTGDAKVWQVIGIVRTANYTTLGEAPQPCVYVPLRQNFSGGMTMYVRSEGNPLAIVTSVQDEIRNLDPNIDISDVRIGAKLIDDVLWSAKVGVTLLGVFGSLALMLASVGLYGVMAYSVAQRRKEIGVRMALGASASTVLGLVLRGGMKPVGYGMLTAVGACLLVGRVLSRLLFGISPADPLSLAVASLVLISVALVACYLPARSATRIDPMAALRDA